MRQERGKGKGDLGFRSSNCCPALNSKKIVDIMLILHDIKKKTSKAHEADSKFLDMCIELMQKNLEYLESCM